MRRKSLILMSGLFLLFTFTGCNVIKQVKTLADCTFAFDGISNVRIAGVSLDKVSNPSQISLTDVAAIISAITNKTAQITFDANVAIKNPNSQQVNVNKLAWKLALDNVELIEGEQTTPIVVNANSTTKTSIKAKIDAAKVLKGSTIESVYTLYQNLTGKNASSKSNVTVKVKPTINNFTFPSYVTINTSL